MGRFFCTALLLLIVPVAKADLLVVQPERSHGYFIGDVLLQRVNLDSSVEPVDTRSIESEIRIGTYLYRMLPKEVVIDKQRWLELRYQIINSPPETETISLPAVAFETQAGGEQLIQPWSFTLAPLTAANPDEALSPVPDRRALDIIGTQRSDTLKLGIAALVTTVALWLLWWLVRHFRDSHTLPFSKASHLIRKLPGNSRDSDPKAWVALHHAFNEVAGFVISKSTVAQLLVAAPWLDKHKDAIEEFYNASSARFYEQVETQPVAVEQLCTILRREEKRQKKLERRTAASLAR